MFKYLKIFILIFSLILSSCAGGSSNSKSKSKSKSKSNSSTSSATYTPSSSSSQGSSVRCDTSNYGDDCNNLEDFILVKKDELIASNIKEGRSIGGIVGNFIGEQSYPSCSEEGQINCVSNLNYRAIDINNHKSKIISSENIDGVSGNFIVPASSTILSTSSYGVNGSSTGMLPNCSDGTSGCYIKPYSQAKSGLGLKALNYDDIDSNKNNIKNGYELISGVVGTQTLCSSGGSDCYINSNFKTVETSLLLSSNIKHDISIGGILGVYSGNVSNCSTSVHTGCLAIDSYPSIPLTFTDYLLSSASINGTNGSIEICDSGESSCYIGSDSFKAVETNKLIAANIKKGVSLAGVSGNYPSSIYPVSGSTAILDLTSSNFNDFMVIDSNFEWFDSYGNRYQDKGNSSLVASNIKEDVEIFGVVGSYFKELPNITALRNSFALAYLKEDRSVICFGSASVGGDCSSISSELVNVVKIFNTEKAFAALKEDGSVVAWGDSSQGGNASSVQEQLINVTNIFVTHKAFAALKSDGSVVSWGDSGYGGNQSSVAAKLSSGVQNIYAASRAFAAVKEDGTVVTWGDSGFGGNSSSVASSLVDVDKVFSNDYSFAALKKDGTVVTWGSSTYGGSSTSVKSKLTNVVHIYSSWRAFAALKSDGSVVTWGYSSCGGSSTSVSSYLTSGVVEIFSNEQAFVALKEDGTVVSWGNSSFGGDSSSIRSQLTDVVQIKMVSVHDGGGAAVALKADGTVLAWGNKNYGGDISAVSENLVNVKEIFYTGGGVFATGGGGFAALKEDGTVVTWGKSDCGGDSSSVSSLLTNVENIIPSGSSFTALRKDGTVVSWGYASYGGEIPSNIRTYTGTTDLEDIIEVFAASRFFIAVKSDYSYVVWGSYNTN